MRTAPPAVLGRARASAKAILLGEHAVVFGRPAVAIPVAAVGVEAVVRPNADKSLTVASRWPGGERTVDVATAADDDPLAVAVRAALLRCGGDTAAPPPWRIDLDSTVPVGRGLGSSAAVAVAIVRAVSAAAGAGLDDRALAEAAFAAERVVHGQPSGIDHTVIVAGRPILFQAGTFRRLAVGAALDVVIADTGRFASTKTMVEGVRALRAADMRAVDAVVTALGEAAAAGAAALERGDGPGLGRAMTAAHEGLGALGVSTPELDALVAAAMDAGAWGAKLAGSGGGGVIVAVAAPGEATTIARACLKAGATWTTTSRLAADDPAGPSESNAGC